MGNFGSKYDIDNKYMYEYNLIQFFVVNQKDPCDELIKFVNDKPELFWHIICHNINDYHCIIHACEHFGYNKDVTKIKIGDKYILFIAIAKDEMHVVEKLLDAGCSIKTSQFIKHTKCELSPLQFATLYDVVDIVELLVNKGANVDHGGDYGFSSVLIAMFNRSERCCELLIAKTNIFMKYEHVVKYYGRNGRAEVHDGDTIFDIIRFNHRYVSDDILNLIDDSLGPSGTITKASA
jgi:ankyrin repeat protein